MARPKKMFFRICKVCHGDARSCNHHDFIELIPIGKKRNNWRYNR